MNPYSSIQETVARAAELVDGELAEPVVDVAVLAQARPQALEAGHVVAPLLDPRVVLLHEPVEEGTHLGILVVVRRLVALEITLVDLPVHCQRVRHRVKAGGVVILLRSLDILQDDAAAACVLVGPELLGTRPSGVCVLLEPRVQARQRRVVAVEVKCHI